MPTGLNGTSGLIGPPASCAPLAALVAMRRSSAAVTVKRLVSARRERSDAVVCVLAMTPAPEFA